jgi:hypothetical protein
MTAILRWAKISSMNAEIPEHLQGPEWGRLPKPKGRLEGLSRTTCHELSEAGLIKSVMIRQPGAQRGIKLIYLPSLRQFLHDLADKQAREKVVQTRSERRASAAGSKQKL